MKNLIVIFSTLISLNASADCYENLTEGYSRDSSHHRIDIDSVESQDSRQMAYEAIQQVYAQNNCGKAQIKELRCGQLGRASWSESCYAETDEGYFFVTPDMVQTVNVIFNRFD